MSVGSYTNQMNYMIKENMRLSTNFTLASPMNGTNPYSKNGFGGSQLFYGANLDYQPTKNLFLKFSISWTLLVKIVGGINFKKSIE